jgi:probable rRNA maturation factor
VGAAATVTVDVLFACSDHDLLSEGEIQTWVDLAVAHSGRSPQRSAEVAVRIVDVDEMRILNARYRQQDKATNVLSFPSGTIDGLPEDEPQSLGDIVVCADVIIDEAREQGKVLADHCGHMLVHGTLHLLGYDHEDEVEAAEMERCEAEILALRGIRDPYTSS